MGDHTPSTVGTKEKENYKRDTRKPNEDTVFWVTLRGKRFCFHTTSNKKGLEPGTELLIQHMDISATDIVLDLMCGFGAKGIVAALLASQGHVHMIDSDPLAVTYAGENAALNYAKQVETYVSDGFSIIDEKRTFHKILFSLPKGMSKEMLSKLVSESKTHLKPGGEIYIATIAGLRRFVQDLFEETFGNYEKVATGKGYVVASATKG